MRSHQRLEIGPHDVLDAANSGVMPMLIDGSHFAAKPVAQRLDRNVEPDPAAIFETISNRVGRIAQRYRLSGLPHWRARFACGAAYKIGSDFISGTQAVVRSCRNRDSVNGWAGRRAARCQPHLGRLPVIKPRRMCRKQTLERAMSAWPFIGIAQKDRFPSAKLTICRPLLSGMENAQDLYGYGVFLIDNDVVCPHQHLARPLHSARSIHSWKLWQLRRLRNDIIHELLRSFGVMI